jgi:hypothetical protein
MIGRYVTFWHELQSDASKSQAEKKSLIENKLEEIYDFVEDSDLEKIIAIMNHLNTILEQQKINKECGRLFKELINMLPKALMKTVFNHFDFIETLTAESVGRLVRNYIDETSLLKILDQGIEKGIPLIQEEKESDALKNREEFKKEGARVITKQLSETVGNMIKNFVRNLIQMLNRIPEKTGKFWEFLTKIKRFIIRALEKVLVDSILKTILSNYNPLYYLLMKGIEVTHIRSLTKAMLKSIDLPHEDLNLKLRDVFVNALR